MQAKSLKHCSIVSLLVAQALFLGFPLMSAPRLAENKQVDAALRGAGIDMAQLKKDLATHRASIDGLLMRNEAEARGLGLRGTPGVLVGRRIVSGISDLETLQSAVAISRRAADR